MDNENKYFFYVRPAMTHELLTSGRCLLNNSWLVTVQFCNLALPPQTHPYYVY